MHHILLQKSKRYTDPVSVNIPKGYVFDNKKGYWIDKNRGCPMITDSKTSIQNSKKWDRETGEDQKGE